MPAAFQLGHTGCVARGDVAVEDQAELGVDDPNERAQAMHLAKKGQPGLQLIQKAGVHAGKCSFCVWSTGTTNLRTTVVGVHGRICAETVGIGWVQESLTRIATAT